MGSSLMADQAISNVAFSFCSIHLTVKRIMHPVSTDRFDFGLGKTMLWSDDSRSEIGVGVRSDNSI